MLVEYASEGPKVVLLNATLRLHKGVAGTLVGRRFLDLGISNVLYKTQQALISLTPHPTNAKAESVGLSGKEFWTQGGGIVLIGAVR